MEGKKKLQIFIDEDLHKWLKIHSVEENKSVTKIVEVMIEIYKYSFENDKAKNTTASDPA